MDAIAHVAFSKRGDAFREEKTKTGIRAIGQSYDATWSLQKSLDMHHVVRCSQFEPRKLYMPLVGQVHTYSARSMTSCAKEALGSTTSARPRHVPASRTLRVRPGARRLDASPTSCFHRTQSRVRRSHRFRGASTIRTVELSGGRRALIGMHHFPPGPLRGSMSRHHLRDRF